jgi:hypothetical protein
MPDGGDKKKSRAPRRGLRDVAGKKAAILKPFYHLRIFCLDTCFLSR